MGFLIGFIIIVIIFVIWGEVHFKSNEKANVCRNDRILENFESKISKKIGSYTFLISEDCSEIVARYDGRIEHRLPKKMNVKNIIGCEIIQDNAIVKQYGIGRAIAGGVLAGGTGAIVGSMTAKQLQEVRKIELKFKTNDIHNPIERFVVYNKGIDNGVNKILEQCDELVATIEILIQQNDNNNM